MNYKEQYLHLLTDSIFSALIFNVNGELIIDVMRILGTYNHIYIIIISTIGSVIGSLANIFLGKMIVTAKKADKVIHDQKNYHILAKYIDKSIYLLLFFSSIHTVGAVIMVTLGIFKKKLDYKYFIILIIGRLLYYSLKLYLN